MKYKEILNYNNRLKLRIIGKNVLLFLRQIIKMNIKLLRVERPMRNQILIEVSEEDYRQIEKLNTSYEIEIVEVYGGLRLRRIIKLNKYFFGMVLISYFILIFLSNVIFDVQVLHSNSNLRSLLLNELSDKGIKRLHFKKSYNKMQLIERDIINRYKDKIEWLEIEEIGTRYIVRVEERKIIEHKEDSRYQHIVAKRNGIIKQIDATQGDIVRIVNEYVSRGDILISGAIIRGEAVVKNVKAIGKVYAEVWYTIRVEYPLTYKEEKETGKEKKIITFILLNKRVSLFDLHPYKDKRIEERIILTHPFLPIRLVREHQRELIITNEQYTKEEALIRAMNIARDKIKDRLIDEEKIISQKNLDISINDNNIIVNIFISILENIGVPQLY